MKVRRYENIHTIDVDQGQEIKRVFLRILARSISSVEMPPLVSIVASICLFVEGSRPTTCRRPCWFNSKSTSTGDPAGSDGGRGSWIVPIILPMLGSPTMASVSRFSTILISTAVGFALMVL